MSSSSVSRPGPFAAGLLAGRYRLEAELGQGGMGVVYRGENIETNSPVAVKSLVGTTHTQESHAQSDILKRFQREGRLLRELNHPNIVGMLDAFEEDGRYYLVTEYVDGGDLGQLLARENRLSIQRSLSIALELADALTRAHHIQVIHRDIKPANVLLAADGTMKLTDFGIASSGRGTRLTEHRSLMGTIAYLSPEACLGHELDERSDIWSFGVLLYQMVLGEVPFGGENVAAVLTAIMGQELPDMQAKRQEIPDGLADVVYRMLVKDREGRIPSARLVGAELEGLLKGFDVTPKSGLSAFTIPEPEGRERRVRLPIQPTPFVGREVELAELARLLAPDDKRLVTILGAGGMGKSRLSLALATSHLDQFPDGVYFVSLAGLSDPEEIVPAIAEATDQRFSLARPQLLDFLREKQLLLLLDNFEHLLEGVDIVSEILGTAPQVKILATSRVKLGVQGEHLFPLAGMDFPEMGQVEILTDNLDYTAMDSVRLFVQSARRVQPGFELGTDDREPVARICRLVQGMPLAIILAAAWMELLTPPEIAAEIAGSIGSSLDFLEVDLQDVPDRHRSMRAVLDHTWRQLSGREQRLMAFTSIFRGGFTRQAAQAITRASLRELMALTSKSLLQRSPEGRFQVHELLRQYAAERLAELADIDSQPAEEWIREQHSAYYCALLERLEPDMRSAAVEPAKAQIWDDLLNMRRAWDWAVANAKVAYLAQALESLSRFHYWQGHYQEGEMLHLLRAAEKLGPLLSLSSSPSSEVLRLYARLRAWQGQAAYWNENPAAARYYCQEALGVLKRPELADQDTRAEKAFALMGLGQGHSRDSREKADYLLRQSLEQYQLLGDRWGCSQVYYNLGSVAYDAGDYGLAEAHCLEYWRLSQTFGHQIDSAIALYQLGHAVFRQGRFEEGENWLRQGVEICRDISNWPGLSLLVNGYCEVLVLLGRFDEARERIEESINHAHHIGHQLVMSFACYHRSEASLHLGQYAEARQELVEILTFFRHQENSWGVALCQHVLACAQMALGADGEASRLLQENNGIYREMNNGERLCWTLVTQSLIASRAGQSAESRLYLLEALELALEIRNPILVIMALPAMALYQTALGEKELAAELYGLAAEQPYVANSRWYEDVVGKQITAIDLPPEVKTAAEERGQARDLWGTAEEQLAQLQA